MFEMNMSLGDLSLGERAALGDLLETRNEYMKRTVKLNELRIAYLRDPDPAKELAISSYHTLSVAPCQDKLRRQTMDILRQAVDVDAVKALLPAVLLGVMRSVNLPLALNALGLEQDDINKVIELVEDYITS